MGDKNIRDVFFDAIDGIAKSHLPTNARFFSRLSELPAEIATLPELLAEIHFAYQAAMHATRAAVYYLPYLDSPPLRQRKLQIFVDDDGLPNGDTHHYQLTRAFMHIGACPRMADEDFGSIEELSHKVDPLLAEFMRRVGALYPRSHGAWCVVEMLSVNWMTALANALAVHFPAILREPYFADCFDNQVEERHAKEALSIAADTLELRPLLIERTLADAEEMAAALDGVWELLDKIVLRFASRPNSDAASQPAIRQ